MEENKETQHSFSELEEFFQPDDGTGDEMG